MPGGIANFTTLPAVTSLSTTPLSVIAGLALSHGTSTTAGLPGAAGGVEPATEPAADPAPASAPGAATGTADPAATGGGATGFAGWASADGVPSTVTARPRATTAVVAV